MSINDALKAVALMSSGGSGGGYNSNRHDIHRPERPV